MTHWHTLTNHNSPNGELWHKIMSKVMYFAQFLRVANMNRTVGEWLSNWCWWLSWWNKPHNFYHSTFKEQKIIMVLPFCNYPFKAKRTLICTHSLLHIFYIIFTFKMWILCSSKKKCGYCVWRYMDSVWTSVYINKCERMSKLLPKNLKINKANVHLY